MLHARRTGHVAFGWSVVNVELLMIRCPNCKSGAKLIRVEGISVVEIYHDDWCPTLARIEGREVRVF